jgi:hypothetical protein
MKKGDWCGGAFPVWKSVGEEYLHPPAIHRIDCEKIEFRG